MSNLELFDYVVPVEHINEFFEKQSTDITVNEPEKRKTYIKPSLLRDADIVKKDIEIYQYALELYNLSKTKSLKSIYDHFSNIPKAKGLVDKINRRHIYGWVFFEGRDDICEVELIVDGLKLKPVESDIFRKGVKERGMHPTGRCGFRFDVKNIHLTKDSDIQVRTKETDEVVPFSKKALEQIKEL